ncbi:hypothetical protein [Cellulomonas palmilytica]|uniref:hypothetical protein n=1 Tax=Cellulomonas palmilytica TaxID=2608402 RepID=UPI001F2C879A|nr:hypothetical protein [Cellulomonas palmilytica]UJP40853.1 hypothetical protein F1D97_05060 [Cellulomonas palmilytica]
MTWRQWRWTLLVLVALGLLLLTPPGFRTGDGERVTCRSLGFELLETVHVDGSPVTDRDAACQDARQDRQTLVVVVLAVVLGVLVVRRGRLGYDDPPAPAGTRRDDDEVRAEAPPAP